MSDLSLKLALGRPTPGSYRTPAPPPSVIRTAPYRLATYGHSFMEWGMDTAGSPNSLDGGQVNPILKKWPTEMTNRVGGTQRGTPGWINALSGGKLVAPYQLNRAVAGRTSQQLADTAGALGELTLMLDAEIAAGRRPDALALDCLSNDMASLQTAAQIMTCLRQIIDAAISRNIKVVISTILPRGSDLHPGNRIDGTGTSTPGVDRRPVCDAVNAAILDLPNETAYVGKVGVVDVRSQFASAAPGARPNDVNDADTLDGLHPSGRSGLRKLAQGFVDVLLARLGGNVTSDLPSSVSDPLNFLGAVGTMQGAGGNIFVRGAAASNTGFAMNGKAAGTAADAGVPAGWTVATGGANQTWSGADPANVKGMVTVSREAAAVGNAMVIAAALDSSGKADDTYSVFLEATTPVTLPAEATLAVGETFEAIARFEISNPIGFRGVDVEMRIAEPDGALRTVRAFTPYPSGDRRTWEDGVGFAGADALVIRTPGRARKTGAYGAITLALTFHFEPKRAGVAATIKVSQVAVKKSETG